MRTGNASRRSSERFEVLLTQDRRRDEHGHLEPSMTALKAARTATSVFPYPTRRRPTGHGRGCSISSLTSAMVAADPAFPQGKEVRAPLPGMCGEKGMASLGFTFRV